MLRRISLALCLAAFAAAIAPAHALNPQPLPPSPCKCEFYKPSYKLRSQIRLPFYQKQLLAPRFAAVR